MKRNTVRSLVLSMIVSLVGCADYGGRLQYCWISDPFDVEHAAARHRAFKRNRQLANAVWAEAVAGQPQGRFSDSYAQGFTDGFTDYMTLGGTGSPPCRPPKQYRKKCYETPDGRRAVEAWFYGFRAGASAARQRGCRTLECAAGACQVKIPTAAVPLNPHGRIVQTAPAEAQSQSTDIAPLPEVLEPGIVVRSDAREIPRQRRKLDERHNAIDNAGHDRSRTAPVNSTPRQNPVRNTASQLRNERPVPEPRNEAQPSLARVVRAEQLPKGQVLVRSTASQLRDERPLLEPRNETEPSLARVVTAEQLRDATRREMLGTDVRRSRVQEPSRWLGLLFPAAGRY